jgi:AraC-like DNA-binding protein
MVHLSISDFEEYADAIQDVDLRCMVTGVKRSYWSFNHREVGSIQIQGGYEGCPVIVEGATHRGQWAFYLQRTGDLGSVNGIRLDPESVFLLPPGGQFCSASPGELDWQSVHIPTEVLFPINSAPEGSHESARVEKPGYGLGSRLRTVVDRFAQAAEIEPSVMTEPASIANFSETLLDTARQILGIANPPADPDRLAASRRQLISSAVQIIEECPEKSLSIKVLAQIVGVAERTLRSAFVDYLGMSPLKYLTLRRLHHARKILQGAAPEELTVSKVAAQLGFWDFGRFAGKYHKLFGELPSEALRRPSGNPPG